MKNDVQNNTNEASANEDKEYHEEVTIVLNGKAEPLEEDPGRILIKLTVLVFIFFGGKIKICFVLNHNVKGHNAELVRYVSISHNIGKL